MNKIKLIFCIFLLTFQALTIHAEEQVTLRKMKVGVFISPPFVMAEENNTYSGMAIDLWKEVESELNVVSQYVNYNSLEKLLSAIQAKEIDIAVTNLTVTYDRAHMERNEAKRAVTLLRMYLSNYHCTDNSTNHSLPEKRS